jgi:tetratricopeptide (TPR) repeat protein
VRVGYLLIAQGEVDAAIEEFEEAIKIDPSSTYSIIRSAIIPELEAHAEEHGSTLLTRYTLGRAYSTIREYSKAADILSENCYASDPHAPSCSEMGVMLMQQGAISEAEEVLQRALELDEALVHAHNNLGIVYSVQGRTSDAVRHLNRALELRPNESRVHYNMGMAYLNMELAEPAANSFRRALELDPKDEEARSKLALAYLRQGNLKEAREIVRELEKEKQRVDLGFITLEMTRLTPQIYRDMAEIYFRSGDAKKAWKYLGEAKKRGFNVTELEQEMLAGTAQPRRVKTADLVEQAAAYYAKQRYDLARNLLEQARSQDASKHQTHYWLGRVARAEDKPEEAAQHLQEAIRLKEKFPDAHLELGRLAYDQENYGVAIGHLDRYLELESYPRNDAYYILGTCHYHQNQLVAAETNLKKAIRGNSDYGDAFYLLAAVYNKQERKEDAIRELNLAVGSRSLSSSFRSEAHYNLAVLYHETGKEQEALKHARIAQRLGYADVGQLLGELAKVIPEADEEIIDSLPEYAAPPQSRSASVGQYEIGEARIGNPPGMARSGQLILGRVRLLRSPEATEQIVLSIKIRSASSRQWQGWMFAYAQVDEEGEGGEAVFGFMLPPSLPQEGEFRCALAVVSDPRAGRLPPPTLSNELEVSFRLVPDTSTSPTLKRRATPQP